MAKTPEERYVHQEFPKMIYRAHPTSGEVGNQIVHSQEDLDAKIDQGWVEHPDDAVTGEVVGPISAEEAETLRDQIRQLQAQNEDLKAKKAKKTAKDE